MPRDSFPQVLQRHVSCAPVEVDGDTVRAGLGAEFVIHATVQGYVLDDTGALRGVRWMRS